MFLLTFLMTSFSISVLMGIAGLLADPNTECRFNAEASNLYRFDRQRYNETAAEFTLVNKDVI